MKNSQSGYLVQLQYGAVDNTFLLVHGSIWCPPLRPLGDVVVIPYCITSPVPCPAFFQDMCILPKRHDECWTLSFSLAVRLFMLHAFSRALEPYYNRISYNIACPSVLAFRKEEREVCLFLLADFVHVS